MSFERLFQVVSLEIIGRMASNRDVIVVNQELDVQTLSNSETSSLCIVALLLRTIGAKTKDDFVPVGEGDTVHMWPHVPETTRRELDTWSEAEFRVARKLGICFAVVQKMFWRKVVFQSREEVLRRDTVTCWSRHQTV
jgi:hypothetical protein